MLATGRPRIATPEYGAVRPYPASWRSVIRGSRDGQPFRKLWLLSRGPMSHGCTHLNTGHIAEVWLDDFSLELSSADVP